MTSTTKQLKREARRLSDEMMATGCEYGGTARRYQTIVEELLRRGEWDW
jgi:hypothetical protein